MPWLETPVSQNTMLSVACTTSLMSTKMQVSRTLKFPTVLQENSVGMNWFECSLQL